MPFHLVWLTRSQSGSTWDGCLLSLYVVSGLFTPMFEGIGFSLVFSPVWSPAVSHSPADAPLPSNSFPLGRWRLTTEPLQPAAYGAPQSRVTCSEKNTICSFLHAYSSGHWLVQVFLINPPETVCVCPLTSRSKNMNLQWVLGVLQTSKYNMKDNFMWRLTNQSLLWFVNKYYFTIWCHLFPFERWRTPYCSSTNVAYVAFAGNCS